VNLAPTSAGLKTKEERKFSVTCATRKDKIQENGQRSPAQPIGEGRFVAVKWAVQLAVQLVVQR
jgi:hypothetical protein